MNVLVQNSGRRYLGSCPKVVATVALTVFSLIAIEKPTIRAQQKLNVQELDRQLFEDLAVPQGDPSDPQQAPTSQAAELKRLHTQGEDPGVAEARNPLSMIARRMRIVQRQLQAAQLSEQTEVLQQQIVQQLDALLQAAQRSPSASGTPQAKQSAGSSSRDETKQTRPGQSPSGQIGPHAQGQAKVVIGSRQEVVHRVWGKLPARVRRRVNSPGGEEFLPAYEQLIEDYYRRLAEADW